MPSFVASYSISSTTALVAGKVVAVEQKQAEQWAAQQKGRSTPPPYLRPVNANIKLELTHRRFQSILGSKVSPSGR